MRIVQYQELWSLRRERSWRMSWVLVAFLPWNYEPQDADRHVPPQTLSIWRRNRNEYNTFQSWWLDRLHRVREDSFLGHVQQHDADKVFEPIRQQSNQWAQNKRIAKDWYVWRPIRTSLRCSEEGTGVDCTILRHSPCRHPHVQRWAFLNWKPSRCPQSLSKHWSVWRSCSQLKLDN